MQNLKNEIESQKEKITMLEKEVEAKDRLSRVQVNLIFNIF
jgi:hypothetical protein